MAPVSLEAGETYELKKWLTRLVKPAAAAGVRYDALASSANDEADENCTTANSQRWTSARRGAAGGWLSKHNLIIALGAVVVLALLGSASYAAQRHQARLRAELDAFKRRPVLVSWHKDPGMNEREPVMVRTVLAAVLAACCMLTSATCLRRNSRRTVRSLSSSQQTSEQQRWSCTTREYCSTARQTRRSR